MSGTALLLVGSPSGQNSNSYSIGQYLLDRLGEAGWATDKELICPAAKDESKMKETLGKMNASDLVILSFPLYVDSLPTLMIRFMEQACAERKASDGKETRMIAVCQSGFPEQHQNDCALRICETFAKDSGFRWAGGLAIGAGSAIGRRKLADTGDMMRALRMALDLTAKAMAEGTDVPREANQLAGKGIPPAQYNQFINGMWQKECEKNKADLEARPYA